MNREIKFRAWNGKEFIKESDIKEYGIDIFSGSLFSAITDSCETPVRWLDKGVIVTQFIGLPDKQGNKIYEGGIIKWGHIKGGEENPIRVAEVKIQPDIQFHIINPKKEFLWNNKVFHYGNFIYKDTENWLEIIGNIFEHPHLLTSNH